MVFEIVFWILTGIIAYSFFGYTLIMLILRYFIKPKIICRDPEFLPVTLLIAAYNEKNVIPEKLANTAALDYPKDKLVQLWVTDGSDDGSDEILKKHNVAVLHEGQRNGKIGAINRGMKFVTTPLVFFTDANAMLNPDAIKQIVCCFADPGTGCVAGEKRIAKSGTDEAAGSGEGIYWKYESFVKKLESDINSTIGAAGEIFAIRSHLFKKVEPDTILDDFVISLRIAQQGYTIKYAPGAVAIERSSINMKEELKRKVRIATGGLQALFRLYPLLNLFRYKMLSFQYWSHKVIRWTIVPLALLLCFWLNLILIIEKKSFILDTFFILQGIFYFFALIGLVFRNVKTHFHLIFVPYYIVTMNYAILRGIARYVRGNQSINWEKAKRR